MTWILTQNKRNINDYIDKRGVPVTQNYPTIGYDIVSHIG